MLFAGKSKPVYNFPVYLHYIDDAFTERKAGNVMVKYGRYVIMLVLFMLVGYLLFYLTYENVKKEMIESFNVRQMVHARQAAIGIENFFNDHTGMLKYLAKNEHIAALDKTGIGLMRDYHLAHSEEISIVPGQYRFHLFTDHPVSAAITCTAS